MTAVHFAEVTKTFGQTTALVGLSFDVPRGAICGLVGPNGAGKTTAMGIIAGLVRPDAGKVDVLGLGPFRVDVHGGRVGIMPQDSVPSSQSSLLDLLRYYAQLGGLPAGAAEEEAQRVLSVVRLGDRARSFFPTLSHGMRRRFSVAQALLGRPELLVFDEPTSGLDPELAVLVRETIAALRGQATVLVSSHILSELEAVCDHVVMLEGGRAIRQGPLQAITSTGLVVRFRLSREPDVSRLGRALPGAVFTWREPWLTVVGPAGSELEAITAVCLREVLDAGIGVRELSAGEGLESAYLRARGER